MLRGASIASVAFIAGILSACQAAQVPDAEGVRQAIDSLNTRLEAWYAAGEIDSVAAVFAEGAWQMPPNSAPLVGRDSLRSFWATAVEWGSWDFDLETQDVVVADSIAVERGCYTLRFTAGPQSPIPSSEDRGNYVVLWRQADDGAWRVVWDAPVSVVPPSGPPVTDTAAPVPGRS